MDERICVNHLDSRGKLRDAIGRAAVERFMRREHQGRPQALAFTEQAIVHDLIDAGRRLQHPVDSFPDVGEIARKGFQSRVLF